MWFLKLVCQDHFLFSLIVHHLSGRRFSGAAPRGVLLENVLFLSLRNGVYAASLLPSEVFFKAVSGCALGPRQSILCMGYLHSGAEE